MTNNERNLDNVNNDELLASISDIVSKALETKLNSISDDIGYLTNKVLLLECGVRDSKDDIRRLHEKYPELNYNIRVLTNQVCAAHESIIKLQSFDESTIMSKLNFLEAFYIDKSEQILESIERFKETIYKVDAV